MRAAASPPQQRHTTHSPDTHRMKKSDSMTSRTITQLRKRGAGGAAVGSTSMKLRIAIYAIVALILVLALALIRMTFQISELTTAVEASSNSQNSAALNENLPPTSSGGYSDGDDEKNGYGYGDTSVGDDDAAGSMMGTGSGGLFFSQFAATRPVLPDLPPLPQEAGSLDARAWEEKNGSYPFTGSVGCRAISSTTMAPCQVHFPLQPNETNRECRDSCLRTRKGQKYADMTNQNQDRSLLVQPLRLKNQQDAGATDDASTKNFLILLADGHGNTGHHAAEQVSRDLPFRIIQSLGLLKSPPSSIRGGGGNTGSDAVTAVLMKDFLVTDEETIKVPAGGATGVVALRLGPSLYLAQAGDSFAFVVRWNKSGLLAGTATIVSEAVRHKPGDPLEKQRIEKAGGEVMMPPIDQPGATSRVVIPDPTGGMLAEALAMSRSLGDVNGKKFGLLTAEPSVVHVDLDRLKKAGGSDSEYFLIVASDGVFDFYPSQQVANFVGEKLYQDTPPMPLQQVMANVLETAAQRWQMQLTMGGYRDDMTLVVSKL